MPRPPRTMLAADHATAATLREGAALRGLTLRDFIDGHVAAWVAAANDVIREQPPVRLTKALSPVMQGSAGAPLAASELILSALLENE